MDISTRQTPSYSHSETIMDMVTLKTTLTTIISTPHTAIMITVQPLVRDTIFTLQTMQILITTLTLTVTRIPVPTATILSGQETTMSAQMKLKFTMKCLLVIEYPVIKLSVIFIRKSDLNHDDLQNLYLIPIEQIGRFYCAVF